MRPVVHAMGLTVAIDSSNYLGSIAADKDLSTICVLAPCSARPGSIVRSATDWLEEAQCRRTCLSGLS